MLKISKYIPILLLPVCIVFTWIDQVIWADYTTYTGKSPTTTDATKATYYNNNLQQNGALSDAAKAYAAKNDKAAQAIIGANDGQCWLKCAAAMEAAAKADSSGTNWGGNKTAANTDTSTENILGIQNNSLRDGNVDMNTIPEIILSIIKTLLAVAGTVAIFSLIYHAVQMQINSGITGDSSGVDKAKKGMIGALIGFVIAISAWFLVTQAVDLLATATT